MRRTKEAAELTRQAILDAAREIFTKKGYSDTTIGDLAEKAEITKGAIYWHFESKADLYHKMLEQSFSGYVSMMEHILAEKTSPLAKIRKMLIQAIIASAEDEQFKVATTLILLRTEITEELKPVIDDIAEFNAQLRSNVASLIRQGIEQGDVDPGVDPDIAALSLIGSLLGTRIITLVYNMDLSSREQVESLVDFQLRSITKSI